MQALVGIIRTGSPKRRGGALVKQFEDLKQQTAKVQVKGGQAYNPGWNLATDLVPSMITTSMGPPCPPREALPAARSHGAGHAQRGLPGSQIPELGKVGNFVQHADPGRAGLLWRPIAIVSEPLPENAEAELLQGSSRKET